MLSILHMPSSRGGHSTSRLPDAVFLTTVGLTDKVKTSEKIRKLQTLSLFCFSAYKIMLQSNVLNKQKNPSRRKQARRQCVSREAQWRRYSGGRSTAGAAATGVGATSASGCGELVPLLVLVPAPLPLPLASGPAGAGVSAGTAAGGASGVFSLSTRSKICLRRA